MAEATAVSDWKKDSQGVPLDVPSGHTCLVRRKPMESFLRRGLIPNALLPIVRRAISGKEMTDEDVAELDVSQIAEMMELYDTIVIDCVVAPKVYPVPHYTQQDVEDGKCSPDQVGQEIPIDDRNSEYLYVDEVDGDDKIFIYNYVTGGTRDLERFRSEQAAAMERLRGSADVASATE